MTATPYLVVTDAISTIDSVDRFGAVKLELIES